MNKTFYDETTHQWVTEPPAAPIPDAAAPESPLQPLEDHKE